MPLAKIGANLNKMNQSNLFKEYEGIFPAVSGEEVAAKEKKERAFGYSPFALQDAIGEKNTKKIWIEYQRLRFQGIEAEELVHKVVSKVRDMVAIKKGATQEDLGMKSAYPYTKSKGHLKNWSDETLKYFYAKLVEAYHRSRMGARPNDGSVGRGDELDLALEKILLNI